MTGSILPACLRSHLAGYGFALAGAPPPNCRLLAQHHLGFALEHAARRIRQLQCAKGFAVGDEMSHRHQLPQRGAPLLLIEFTAYSEHREPVMLELPDAVGHAADQNIDQVPSTKP